VHPSFADDLKRQISFTAYKLGSSSHKEQHPIAVQIDIPVLVLKALIQKILTPGVQKGATQIVYPKPTNFVSTRTAQEKPDYDSSGNFEIR
jgi:hypothetical protein